MIYFWENLSNIAVVWGSILGESVFLQHVVASVILL